MCVDYRELNSITPQIRGWLPSLNEIVEKAGSARVLSKLDLAKGYYQLKVKESVKDSTMLICPFGKYRFKQMPFGLKNAPAIFQAAVEKVLISCS